MEASVQRDSLVYVPAAAAYAIVFAASDDGVCEVGLIDPGADDYSLSVPTASVEPMEPAGPESMADLAAQLAVLHLRVSRGIDVARSFEAFVGRAESGSLELWFSRGSSRATLLAELDPTAEKSLRSALEGLDLGPWSSGGPARTPSLDDWGWSVQAVGARLGTQGYGRAAAPAGLEALVSTLRSLGAPVSWGTDGPVADAAADLPHDAPAGPADADAANADAPDAASAPGLGAISAAIRAALDDEA